VRGWKEKVAPTATVAAGVPLSDSGVKLLLEFEVPEVDAELEAPGVGVVELDVLTLLGPEVGESVEVVWEDPLHPDRATNTQTATLS
jgi:hypothetical protein